jgi:hypothetical protein
MKFPGFIGPTYQLDSVNVDAQRCVNLYPEVIESGTGKEAQQYYYKATPGLQLHLTVGTGPIRLIHRDSIGRILVVSGNKFYRIAKRSDWKVSVINYTGPTGLINQGTGVDVVNDWVDNVTNHGYATGSKVRVSSSTALPAPLVVATDYWVVKVTATTYRFATSLANASAGTYIDITTTGSGTMTVTYQGAVSANKNIDFDNDISTATGIFTKVAHTLFDGERVKVTTLGTPLPGGLTLATVYYVIKVSADTFKLATTVANAVAGIGISIPPVTGAWAATKLYTGEYSSVSEATLTTSVGPIRADSMSLAGNGLDSTTVFTDGVNNYLFSDTCNPDPTVGAIFEYASPGGGGSFISAQFISSHVVWIDGYFLLNEVGTNRFWASNLQSVFIDALSYASAEGSPDALMAVARNQRYFWAFNQRTTEIYANTGNASFPFERVGGGFIETGIAAKFSLAKAGQSLLWIGQDELGGNVVYQASGLTPTRVSTHAVEQAIGRYADPTTATAFSYQSKGHLFYVLNFTEATWVYDLSTGLWHERAFTTAGVLGRHRVECHVYDPSSGYHFGGDYLDGRVYLMNDSYYSDDGQAITRMRSFPHVSAGSNRVFCSKLQLDMQTGIGLNGAVQGSNPTVTLDFSNDGGHTWSSETYALADAGSGQIGAFKTRVIWRRLGSFRDRVFRLKMTDPVPCTWLGVDLIVTPGTS